jgi:hypothetical protein
MTGRIIPIGRRRGAGGGIDTPADVNHPTAVIQFSDLPDRSDMVNWSGAVVSGNVYVGITNTNPEISLVSWYLNPANVGALGELVDPSADPSFVRSDATVPYDFQGGTTAANPFNTTAQANGASLIAIRVVYVDGFVSVFSATATISNVAPGDPPGAPVLTSITAPANGQARMAWQVATNTPTSYDVQRSASGAFTSPTTVNTGGTSLTYLWTGLAAGTYHMRTRGVNAFGDGAWSNSLTVVVTAGGGYGVGNADGELSGAWLKRVSCQGQNINNSDVVHPLSFKTINADRKVPLANKISVLTGAPAQCVATWNAGRRPSATTFDGPQCQLYVTLGWGVSAKKFGKNGNVINWHTQSLHNLAATWNGVQDAAWRTVVDSWIANRSGGYSDWTHRMWIRLGLELGPWFPDFPGVDSNLVGDLGTTSLYSAEINAAMNQVNVDGDRFPIFKGAWDHVVGLIRGRCAAAGVVAPIIMPNFVDGAADPGDSGTSGPSSQFVPGVATDVEETPDVNGLDIYGRGADVRPSRLPGRPADGNPVNYDFTDLRTVLDRIADLCLEVNRPISFPEWWSNRKRDPDGGGEAWNDHERAAFTRYMADYIDTGCGGKGVAVHSHSPFIQQDNVAGTDTGNRQISNNTSYTYMPANDELSSPHPPGTPTSPAPLMRAALYDLWSPTEVDPI